MDRREALSAISLLFGGVVAGSAGFLQGCTPKETQKGIIPGKSLKLMEALAEFILPKTENSPGARDVGIAEFMSTIVTDCYKPEEQQALLAGVATLEQTCNEKYGKKFIKLHTDEKTELLISLEKEAKSHDAGLPPEAPRHYYTMIKQLTLWGYLSSEPVGTKILRNIAVPGRYDGCIPYEKGEKAWTPYS